MNIREINKPITAKALNESLAARFGKKIKLEDFTLEQLQNTRNKLRTVLSQVETMESFNAVQNDTYQKNKLFLDVLNAEIAEREDVAEAKPDFLDLDKDGDKKEPMKKAANDKGKGKGGKPQKGKVPPQFAKNKKTNEMSDEDKAARKQKAKDIRVGSKIDKKMNPDAELTNKKMADKAAGKKKAGDMLKKMAGLKVDEGKEIINNYFAYVLSEGAEDQAELVMAAKDMVDRLTSWMEDTAEMQTESMLELADAIRDEQGNEKSEAFIAVVKPALESLYTAMEGTRGALTQGVGMLTGEAEVPQPMGDEMPAEEPEMEPTVDQEEGDDFAAAEPAAGGEEEAGRARRESVSYSKKKVIENSRKLATLLSKKKE